MREIEIADALAKMSDRQKQEYRVCHDAAVQLEWNPRHAAWNGRVVPWDWRHIPKDMGEKKKTRVTIRLDEDLVAVFRKTGKDWQPRLNAVVRAFVQARLAGMVRGAGDGGR